MMKHQLQKIHPRASIEQIKNCQLFLITYPGLVLALSYNTLIAFNFDNKWHLSTQKISRITDKHKYHLLDLIHVTYWYEHRKDLLKCLRYVIKHNVILTAPRECSMQQKQGWQYN